MPAASVLAPSALLAATAASGWVLERCGVLVSRWLAAGAAWLALAVLLATWWATGRATLELNLPGTLAGAPLALRLDAIGVAFGLVVLLPVALLFTFQRRSSAEASVAGLAAGRRGGQPAADGGRAGYLRQPTAGGATPGGGPIHLRLPGVAQRRRTAAALGGRRA